jgi:hypothetical protein
MDGLNYKPKKWVCGGAHIAGIYGILQVWTISDFASKRGFGLSEAGLRA